MREFVVDLTDVTTFDQFVEAFNEGLCRHCDGRWHGRSWDAFHDYLSWPEEDRYRLVVQNWAACSGLNEEDRTCMILDIFSANPHVNVVLR